MILARRGFLIGLGSVLAAPAIVRIGSIMPVKAIEPYVRSPAIEFFEMIMKSNNHIMSNAIDWDAVVRGMIPADRAYWQKNLLSAGT